MHNPPRAWALLALAAYALALAVVLLQPSAGAAITTVGGVSDWLRSLGASREVVTNDRVELVLNALMVAPVPFLGAWVLPRLTWTDWVTYAFLASMGVEVLQALFLDNRIAQFVDVVGNTSGGVLGALMAVAWRRPHQEDLAVRSSLPSGVAR